MLCTYTLPHESVYSTHTYNWLLSACVRDCIKAERVFGSCDGHSGLIPLHAVMQSVAMLRNITQFHTLATAAVERTAGAQGGDQKITYNVIKNRLGDLLYKITSQKFEDPAEGEEAIK